MLSGGAEAGWAHRAHRPGTSLRLQPTHRPPLSRRFSSGSGFTADLAHKNRSVLRAVRHSGNFFAPERFDSQVLLFHCFFFVRLSAVERCQARCSVQVFYLVMVTSLPVGLCTDVCVRAIQLTVRISLKSVIYCRS